MAASSLIAIVLEGTAPPHPDAGADPAGNVIPTHGRAEMAVSDMPGLLDRRRPGWCNR